MSQHPQKSDLLQLTTEIVSAHLSNNIVAISDLPSLIRDVHNTLASIGEGLPKEEPIQPAVPIKKSVTPEYIICLEDGQKLKMLKRYLRTNYNLTPDSLARYLMTSLSSNTDRFE